MRRDGGGPWRPGWVARAAAEWQAMNPEEVAMAAAVRAHARTALPLVENGDAGPRGFARGAVEVGVVQVMSYDAKARRDMPRDERVIRRKGPRSIAGLPEHCRLAADRYAGAVERFVSVRAPGDGGGRRSDGGVVGWCAAGALVRRCQDAIGEGLVLDPSRRLASPEWERAPLTAREAVDAAVLDGLAVLEILARWGWSRAPGNARAVRGALEDRLGRVADALGLATSRGLTGVCE